MKKTLTILMALALPFMALGVSWGQGEEPKYDFAYGALVSKSGDQITISEYNFDTDAEENVAYVVNEWTDFEGGAGPEGLDVGDSVEILYTAEEGRRVAVSVAESKEDEGQDDAVEEDSGAVELEGVEDSGLEEQGEQEQPEPEPEYEGEYRG